MDDKTKKQLTELNTQCKEALDLIKQLDATVAKRVDKILAAAAGPCDAIDAAVLAQQATVDAAANQLVLEQLVLLILVMQQTMCHMMNP